jgi:hypothetical protein
MLLAQVVLVNRYTVENFVLFGLVGANELVNGNSSRNWVLGDLPCTSRLAG